MSNVNIDSWEGIINDAKEIGERIDSFADRIDDANELKEFYVITNNLFRLISMANNNSVRATEEAKRLHKSTVALMATTLTFGEA